MMFAQERHHAIREMVRKQRRMNFEELQRLVKVSPATLRRDLTELERAGEVIRVHGGVLDPSYARAEISFDERLLRNGPAKRDIARVAAGLVPAGATVLIDAGSTCLEAGKALLGRKDVRIITHSVALLQAGLSGKAEIICVGGELRRVSGALTGGAALHALGLIRADMAFVGASGLHALEGCSTTELSEAEMKKAMLARAKRKVLLADFSKWGEPSTVRFAMWEDFNDLVSNDLPSVRERNYLRTFGLTLHHAQRVWSGKASEPGPHVE
jgi:DeoR/GlpR family transcriptional regulator of sugar metabolism